MMHGECRTMTYRAIAQTRWTYVEQLIRTYQSLNPKRQRVYEQRFLAWVAQEYPADYERIKGTAVLNHYPLRSRMPEKQEFT